MQTSIEKFLVMPSTTKGLVAPVRTVTSGRSHTPPAAAAKSPRNSGQSRERAEAGSRGSTSTTTLVHFDHMNDHRGYCKLLATWTNQLRISGVLFLPLHTKPRPRHIFAVLDATRAESTGEFLRRLRTSNVDVNMRGQPCKERMSTVVEEWSIASDDSKLDENGGLTIIETEGGTASQGHMPFVREHLRQHRSSDADTLITAMERYLDEHTKPGKRR